MTTIRLHGKRPAQAMKAERRKRASKSVPGANNAGRLKRKKVERLPGCLRQHLPGGIFACDRPGVTLEAVHGRVAGADLRSQAIQRVAGRRRRTEATRHLQRSRCRGLCYPCRAASAQKRPEHEQRPWRRSLMVPASGRFSAEAAWTRVVAMVKQAKYERQQ